MSCIPVAAPVAAGLAAAPPNEKPKIKIHILNIPGQKKFWKKIFGKLNKSKNVSEEQEQFF